MTNYNHKFKKNLIADWIGRDLSAALRRGVVRKINPQNFCTKSVNSQKSLLNPLTLGLICCLSTFVPYGSASAEVVSEKYIANRNYIAPNNDLVITMENRNSGIFANTDKDVSIEVNSLTIVPNSSVLTKNAVSYYAVSLIGGNEFEINSNHNIDINLNIEEGDNIQKAPDTIAAFNIGNSTNAKKDSKVSVSSLNGDISLSANNSFDSGSTYAMRSINAKEISFSASNISFEAKGNNATVALALKNSADASSELYSANFSAQNNLSFIANSTFSSESNLTRNSTAVEASYVNADFFGNSLQFEAVANKGKATALLMDGVTALFAKDRENYANDIKLIADGKQTSALSATNSNIDFNANTLTVKSSGKSNVKGIELKGGEFNVNATSLISFDLDNSSEGSSSTGIISTDNSEISVRTDDNITFNISTQTGSIDALKAGITGSSGKIDLTAGKSIVISLAKTEERGNGQNVYAASADYNSEINLNAKENILIDKTAILQPTSNGTYDTMTFRAHDHSQIDLVAGGYLSVNPSSGINATDEIFRAQSGSTINAFAYGSNDDGYGIIGISTGAMSRGILSQDGFVSLTSLVGSIGLSAKGGQSRAIEINSTTNDSKVSLNSADSIRLLSETDGSFTNGLSIALFASGPQYKADIILDSKNDISVQSTGKNYYTYGIQTIGDSALIDLNASNINLYTTVTDKPNYAYGIFAAGGNINLLSEQDTSVISTGVGLHAQSKTKINVLSNNQNFISAAADENGFGTQAALITKSQSNISMEALNSNIIQGAVVANGSKKVADDASTSIGIKGKTNNVSSYAYISNAGDLKDDENFKNKRVISALYAEGADATISLSGEQNYLSTFADSSVHTDLERVVWAYDGADINIDGFTSITTDSYEKSLNSIDIAIAAGTAVNLTEDIVNADVADRAQVQINYANTTDSEGKAVLSSVTGDILSAYAGSVNIAPKSASDGLVVTGNLLAGNNGELTVDIGANGVLTGRADDYGDAGFIKDSEHTTFFDPAFSSEIFKGGQVNLKMGDNARWNVTGQSWITDISVADGAKNVLIDLVNDNTNRNSTAHALTVYNLKGNATFNMSLDGNRDVSDMLYIRNANGEYIVNVVDAVTVDDMYKGGLNGLRFATVGAGSKAKFRAFTYDKGALNVEYEVATDSYDNNPENDIYNGTEMSHEKPGSTVVDGLFGYEEGAVATLALNDEAATKAADGTISETTNFKLVDRKDATPSDSGKTIIDHARANYANAVQLDTLNKRQGEMRFSQGHEDGLWARIRHDDIGKRSSFRLDNTMVEVGVDSRYVKETGEFHTGVAFDYMNGDTDYHHISGEGDLDRYGVWFYTTWLGNEGDYTDFIIKCSLIDNEYKIYAPTTGEKITGDYDNNVISVSLEHGKKYSNEESWFIEPQAQLQYAYVTSAEYTNSQGTDVRLDGIHSLIGRVGVRAGKDVTRDNPFTFYARGDIMHEFMGKQDIKAKDTTGTMRVRYENDDTWYSAGLGMSYQHNKDKYYFLEAEKVFGGSNTSSYIVSGGVRFLFD